jgi:hypothetical protein
MRLSEKIIYLETCLKFTERFMVFLLVLNIVQFVGFNWFIFGGLL